MQLSKHFSLREFTKSATAKRLGIDNTPPPELIANGIFLCQKVMEPVRSHFGGHRIYVTSGYRCLQLNRAVGSSDTSQHIKFEADDFTVDTVSVYDTAKWVAESDLPFDQVIYEFEDWVHVSCTTRHDPRREALTIYRTDSKIKIQRGIIQI